MTIAINMSRSKSILFHFIKIQIRINATESFLRNFTIALSLNRISNILNIVDKDLR